nr:MAG TPA: hypothetical protein [Caudoviricetes sp.]
MYKVVVYTSILPYNILWGGDFSSLLHIFLFV